MVVVYYQNNNKYHSFDGDKFTASYKRPQGFQVCKGFTPNQKGLKKYHRKIQEKAKEIQDKGITKKNIVLDYKTEIDAKFFMLNAYLPEQYRMKKGQTWFNQFPDIEYQEHIFMNNCNNAGLLYTQKGIFENVSAYDVNSFFPRVLGYKNSQFQIPISEPKFKQLESLPKKLEYGIYRVKITYKGESTDDVHKVFNFSKTNYYTHIDLKYALFLQTRYDTLKVRLINDGQNNAMTYDKFISSKSLFGGWFKNFYEGKKQAKGNFLLKRMLNIWGYICRYTHRITKKLETIEKWELSKQEKFHFEYHCEKKGEVYFSLQKKNNIYRYGIARMKPFLVSVVRQRMRDYISSSKCMKQIVRIYIDSFILSEDNQFFEKKTESIKHDKYHKKDVEIKALNNIKILN